jgi:hypothetical protein
LGLLRETISAARWAARSRKIGTFIFGNFEGLEQRLAIPTTTFSPDANARLIAAMREHRNSCLRQGCCGRDLTAVPGVDSRILPYLLLWPVPTQILGGGIGLAFSGPNQSIRQDFGMYASIKSSPKDTLTVRI